LCLLRKPTEDNFELSQEVDRALRNMLDLRKVSKRNAEGQRINEDSAKIFATDFQDPESLANKLLEKINSQSRSKTIFLNEKNEQQNEWLFNTFKTINHATHPQVSLAKHITIFTPQPLFGSNLDCSIRVVDTKGIDETVNREDLDKCLTDDHTVSVICCRFDNAPDNTMRSLLKNIKSAGLENRIKNETVLLILDRENEAKKAINGDEPIDDKDEGREIRAEDIKDVIFRKLSLNSLDIRFFDAKNDDVSELYKHLPSKISKLREVHYKRLSEFENEVRNIVLNIRKELVSQSVRRIRNVENEVKKRLNPWLKKAQNHSPELKKYFSKLIGEISDTPAQTIRATANRKGRWENLDFYFLLAQGAREQITEQIEPISKELSTLIENMQSQDNLKPANMLLERLDITTKKRMEEIYRKVSEQGRAKYRNELINDSQLWNMLQRRWGEGSGYREDIAEMSRQWFEQRYQQPESEINQYVKEQWQRYIKEMQRFLNIKKL